MSDNTVTHAEKYETVADILASREALRTSYAALVVHIESMARLADLGPPDDPDHVAAGYASFAKTCRAALAKAQKVQQ
jgi:hypothetical protein